MQQALIVDNKIVEIHYDGAGEVMGHKEVPDSAKVGDVFDYSKASREDNIKTELPSIEEMVEALWQAVFFKDNADLDALEARRKEIFEKYPL